MTVWKRRDPVRDTKWYDEAVCLGDWPVFDDESRDGYAEAKPICGECPVKAECLDDALRTEWGTRHTRHGVRGGLTPEERAAVARKTGIGLRPPIICGEPGSATAHRRRGEEPCAVDLEAEVQAKRRRAEAAARTMKHGTRYAYDKHRELGHDPCQVCRDAMAAKERERVAKTGTRTA